MFTDTFLPLLIAGTDFDTRRGHDGCLGFVCQFPFDSNERVRERQPLPARRRCKKSSTLWPWLLLGPFLPKKKIKIRDLFVVNRDFFFVTIHNKKITIHDMNCFSFSLKK